MISCHCVLISAAAAFLPHATKRSSKSVKMLILIESGQSDADTLILSAFQKLSSANPMLPSALWAFPISQRPRQ